MSSATPKLKMKGISTKVKVSKELKGKAKAERPAKKQKPSQRPRYSASPPASDDGDDDDEDDTAERLAALERMQAEFLADALPAASTSRSAANKSVWDMGMSDFEDDDEDDSEDEVSDEEEGEGSEDGSVAGGLPQAGSSNGPVVIAFEEPRLSNASGGGGSSRDLRNFMSTKVKSLIPTFSVADEMNARKVGKARAVEAVDAEEEAHLASLDSSLSSLIRPLTSATGPTSSMLPTLLATLPSSAPEKPLKGLTPLPKNAPRTLRRGQNAANLKRAQTRDAAAGVLAGAKRGREATTLKEKRKEEGSDKRQRGLNGAVGKMKGGGLYLSKDDIARGSGVPSGGGSSSGGGRGGKRGGGGGGRGGGKKGGRK